MGKKRTEFSNFYYNLTDRNLDYLASYVSVVAGTPKDTILRYFAEIENGESLRLHFRMNLFSLPHMRDSTIGYARRVAWYAFIRALKPRTVIETGVYQGIGSCIIASALMRNGADGFEGKYIGIDIDPNAGELFLPPYSEKGEIIIADSVTTLKSFDGIVDVFISDSDHSHDYELQEYLTIRNKVTAETLIISDNSRTSLSLSNFSLLAGRKFLFFKEEPVDHWYPGAGIGCSY